MCVLARFPDVLLKTHCRVTALVEVLLIGFSAIVLIRVTGETVDPKELKTYSESLAQYHLSCEDKFANGQFLDRGRTERRHVIATGFAWIGKEANQSGEAHPILSATAQFG